VGQVVKVRVLSVDQPLQRISLSMKLQQRPNAPASPARQRGDVAPRRRRKRPGSDRAAAPARKTASALPREREAAPERELSMEEKLRALQVRFRQVDKS
jgi:transcriptional accessory protein Tex/SPT6